jgi:hypothetical protein
MLKVAAGGTILTNNASLTNTSTGVLAGSGNVLMRGNTPGTLFNNGVIAPGGAGAAGTLSIFGDVNFGATGRLNAERFSSTSFDRLAITGTAALGGIFGLTDTAPALLPGGSFYTVLNYGSKTGTFTTLDVPAPYSVVYLADRMNITSPNLISSTGGPLMQAANQVISNMSTLLTPPQTSSGAGSFQGASTDPASPTLPKCGAPKLKGLVACTP